MTNVKVYQRFHDDKKVEEHWYSLNNIEPEILESPSDSDFNLVSAKNMSEILPSHIWGPGPNNLGQKGLNLPYLCCHW